MSFAAPGANWPAFTGQMHYSNAAGKSVIGEVVVRRSPYPDAFQFQFSSGPGFPLLKLYESGLCVRAEGLFARGSWQGSAASAPAHLRHWVQLREVFAQLAPGRAHLSGTGWTAEAQPAGPHPVQLTVSFPEGGERFAFHFSR